MAQGNKDTGVTSGGHRKRIFQSKKIPGNFVGKGGEGETDATELDDATQKLTLVEKEHRIETVPARIWQFMM